MSSKDNTMENKTPIQTAIEFWNERKNEAPTYQLQSAAEMFIKYLESLLSKEKEFAEKCFDAGRKRAEFNAREHGSAYEYLIQEKTTPDKQQFINQLYPEK